jgi:hypothetical protein
VADARQYAPADRWGVLEDWLHSDTGSAEECYRKLIDRRIETMALWRTMNIGRWCAMLGPSVSGKLLLICHDTTIIFAGRSVCELLAAVMSRACRAFRYSIPLSLNN